MKAPVSETLAVAFIAVVMLVGLEKMHETALIETHQDGFAQGYALGQSALSESMARKVSDKACMAFWFGGDSQRVGKAIQKVSIK